MAASKYVSFAGPSYHLVDRKAAIQSAINCYPQRLDADKVMMQSIPGEVEIADLGEPVRGSRTVNGRFFVAAGNSLYEVNTDGTTTVRGSVSPGAGYVGMANNRTQLCMVDGAGLYVFNTNTNTMETGTPTGWLGSYEVVELDGYFIFVRPDTDQFYISAIDDGTSIDALDFSSADSGPDNIVTQRVSHRQLWLFGDLSTEIWINSGDIAFPFVRYNSYTLDVGCVGRRAAINTADTLFWVGKTSRGTGIVYMATGNQPTRVSTTAVEQALLSSTDLSQATMWTYQIEGHEFVAINAPGLDTTWVYDAALQMWHERGEWDAGWFPIRTDFVQAFNGGHYSGDVNGKITRLDAETYTLNGRVLVHERTWPHMIAPSMEPVSYKGLELAMTTGYGGNVTLEISNDGGATFGPPLLRSLGAIGRWMQRVRWLGLGTAFNRVFRIRCSDPVPFAIHDATVDF